MNVVKQILNYLKSKAYQILVAYMLGLHNFYNQEEKSKNDIQITIEQQIDINDDDFYSD